MRERDPGWQKTKGTLISVSCERRYLNQTTQEKAAFEKHASSNMTVTQITARGPDEPDTASIEG